MKILNKHHSLNFLRFRDDLNEIRVYNDYCEMDLYDRCGDIVAVTTFDVNDLPKVNDRRWYRIKDSHTCYVRSDNPHGHMHKIILNPPLGFEVDHRDGNGLNNRRSNLRSATRQQQMFNMQWSSSNTKVKGIQYRGDCPRRPFMARVMRDHQAYVAHFETLKEAENWLQETRIQLHGGFANHGEYSDESLSNHN